MTKPKNVALKPSSLVSNTHHITDTSPFDSSSTSPLTDLAPFPNWQPPLVPLTPTLIALFAHSHTVALKKASPYPRAFLDSSESIATQAVLKNTSPSPKKLRNFASLSLANPHPSPFLNFLEIDGGMLVGSFSG